MKVKTSIDSKLRVRLKDLPEGAFGALTEALSIPNLEKLKAQKLDQWGWQRMPDWISLWDTDGDDLVMPRGFLADYAVGMMAFGCEVELVECRTWEPIFKAGTPVKPRPYQKPQMDAILAHEQGIIKAPAGSGKTVSILATVQKLGCKSLVIVNTKDILWQWQKRVEDFLGPHYPFGQIGDGKFEISPYITIATAQTLHSRFDELEANGFFDEFSFVCLDECFPAGTLISTPEGSRPIESLRVGDVVYGVNHETGHVEPTEIRHTFERDSERLVEVGGVKMTPNHPVFTQRGYVRADDVVLGDTITFLDASYPATSPDLRAVWAGFPSLEADRALLLQALRDEKARQQTGQSVQDGRWNDQGEITFDQTRSGLLVPVGRQWSWADRAAEDPLGRARRSMGAGVHLQDGEPDSWAESGRRSASALQDRLGERVKEDRRGVGRRGPSVEGAARAGQAKDGMAGSAWLDSHSRPEQGRAALHVAGRGPHRVFNVETGLGNYFASGLLVHNCHHATAETYNKIFDRFSARYRVGVSATPDKTGDFALAINVLGPIIHETKPSDVPDLTKPKVIRVPTKFGFSFRGHVNRWQRSNYGQMIDAIIRDEDRNALIVRCVMENQGHHQLLVSKRLEHLEILGDLLLDAGFRDPITSITGRDDNETREHAVHLASTEPSLILSTLADEALDIPRLDRLHLPYPQRNAGLVTQQVGRVERVHPDKKDAIIYDYADGMVGPLEKQWRIRRFEVYQPRGYKIEVRKTVTA